MRLDAIRYCQKKDSKDSYRQRTIPTNLHLIITAALWRTFVSQTNLTRQRFGHLSIGLSPHIIAYYHDRYRLSRSKVNHGPTRKQDEFGEESEGHSSGLLVVHQSQGAFGSP